MNVVHAVSYIVGSIFSYGTLAYYYVFSGSIFVMLAF